MRHHPIPLENQCQALGAQGIGYISLCYNDKSMSSYLVPYIGIDYNNDLCCFTGITNKKIKAKVVKVSN